VSLFQDNGCRAGATLALAAALSSCTLIDLRTVSVTVDPSTPYTVLQSCDAVITVRFSAEPLRLEAERAFSVQSGSGAVEGDFTWDGTCFSWKPVSPWEPGVRYQLMLSGTIQTVDGREARPEIELPFYVLRASGPPLLVLFSPEDGATTGVGEKGSEVLTLWFSEPMDGRTVRDALSLRPSSAFGMSWSADLTTVSLILEEPLSPCASYVWTLATTATALDGAPVPRETRASFVTDLDATAPRVERTFPVILSSGAWIEAAPDLSFLDAGQSIAVLFSEAVETASARSSVRIDPSRTGYVDAVSPRLVVYTPERDWEPGTALTLLVSDDVKDVSGLSMVEGYRELFTPIVPFLRVLQVESGDGELSLDLGGDAVLPVTVGAAPDGLFIVTISFSSAFDAAAKVAALEGVSLSVFFPSSIPVPSLRSVSWPSDDTMSLHWEGFRRSDPGSTHYYRLSVTGGQSGVRGGSGLYLEEDASIYLEAKQ
jgi:hypothetical protein